MSTIPAQTPRTTEVLNISDFTTPTDQALMFRVRQRLASRGLQLELRAEKHGWRWAITGQPPLTATSSDRFILPCITPMPTRPCDTKTLRLGAATPDPTEAGRETA
jgi:hypothetical protein